MTAPRPCHRSRNTAHRCAPATLAALEPRRLMATVFGPDLTFADGGMAKDVFGPDVQQTAAVSFVQPLAGGKILVGGTRDGAAVLSRLTATGQLDTTFNTDGISDVIPSFTASGGTVQADGKIL